MAWSAWFEDSFCPYLSIFSVHRLDDRVHLWVGWNPRSAPFEMLGWQLLSGLSFLLTKNSSGVVMTDVSRSGWPPRSLQWKHQWRSSLQPLSEQALSSVDPSRWSLGCDLVHFPPAISCHFAFAGSWKSQHKLFAQFWRCSGCKVMFTHLVLKLSRVYEQLCWHYIMLFPAAAIRPS